VVFEKFDTSGCVGWRPGWVNQSGIPGLNFRRFEFKGPENTACVSMKTFDALSIVYNTFESRYMMALTDKSSLSQAYGLTPNGTSWFGLGTIYNDSNSFISAVVFAQRSTNQNPQAWFIKYHP
jgi:hypothetical protein